MDQSLGETACEKSIRRLEGKIMGFSLASDYLDEIHHSADEDTDRRMLEHTETLNFIDVSVNLPSIVPWLNEIDSNAKIVIENDAAGDADNVYFNKAFSGHFLRLCKLLPLWSAISCHVFGTPVSKSSSANVESYFKDVKMIHKDIIPCAVDVFAKKHMDGMDDAIIAASRKCAKFIGPKITPNSNCFIENSTEMYDSNDSDPNIDQFSCNSHSDEELLPDSQKKFP